MSQSLGIKLKGAITNTVSITDYQMVSPTVARVILSFTGKQTPSTIASAIADITRYQATAVENSFRKLNASTAVGYIRTSHEIRPVTESEIRAGYKSASANILMSNEDDTLWEVKKVGDTTYLSKQNEDDLEDLVAAVSNHNTISTARLSTLASIKPNRNELVAFVTNSGDVDYGFVTATGKSSVKIQAKNSAQPVVASINSIIGSYEVEIDKKTSNDVKARVKSNVLKAAKSDDDIKATMADYYKELYSYDPEYLAKIIKQIDETSFA